MEETNKKKMKEIAISFHKELSTQTTEQAAGSLAVLVKR